MSTPRELVGTALDPAQAWQRLDATVPQPKRGILRRFRHVEVSRCYGCNGTGEDRNEWDTRVCASCNGSGKLVDEQPRPYPQTVDDCIDFAERGDALPLAEQLAWDALPLLSPWDASQLRFTNPPAEPRVVVEWCRHCESLLSIPEPVRAIARALGNPDAPTRAELYRELARRYADAVTRNSIVPDGPPRGRPFSELPSPFAPLLAVLDVDVIVQSTSNLTITLEPIPRGR